MMTLQILPPWHSMEEKPEFKKSVTLMGCDFVLPDSELFQRTTIIVDERDWETEKNGKYLDYGQWHLLQRFTVKPFAWCYTLELAAMEFRKMLTRNDQVSSQSCKRV